MISRAKNLKKKTYSDVEVASIHNKYRLIMFGMLIGFIWVAWYFGIIDDIGLVFGITVNPEKGFFSVIKTIGASVVSGLGVVFALLMAWEKFFKKIPNSTTTPRTRKR